MANLDNERIAGLAAMNRFWRCLFGRHDWTWLSQSGGLKRCFAVREVRTAEQPAEELAEERLRQSDRRRAAE